MPRSHTVTGSQSPPRSCYFTRYSIIIIAASRTFRCQTLHIPYHRRPLAYRHKSNVRSKGSIFTRIMMHHIETDPACVLCGCVLCACDGQVTGQTRSIPPQATNNSTSNNDMMMIIMKKHTRRVAPCPPCQIDAGKHYHYVRREKPAHLSTMRQHARSFSIGSQKRHPIHESNPPESFRTSELPHAQLCTPCRCH